MEGSIRPGRVANHARLANWGLATEGGQATLSRGDFFHPLRARDARDGAAAAARGPVQREKRILCAAVARAERAHGGGAQSWPPKQQIDFEIETRRKNNAPHVPSKSFARFADVNDGTA